MLPLRILSWDMVVYVNIWCNFHNLTKINDPYKVNIFQLIALMSTDHFIMMCTSKFLLVMRHVASNVVLRYGGKKDFCNT